MAKPRRRAYEEIRTLVERNGGRMSFQRKGYQYGAWTISYAGKKKAFPSEVGSFPGLDDLYVPKISNPRFYNDYSNVLVDNSWEKLVESLGEEQG